jgi:hypothetical protein
MLRGGYTGDKVHEVKFRATPRLYETLKAICEEQQAAMAFVLRDLVTKGLEQRQQAGPGSLSEA